MWFDLDKLKQQAADMGANEKSYACDCGRVDGWHKWSCVTLPETLRAVERQIEKDQRRWR